MSNSHMEIFWIVNVNNKIFVPHCSCKTVPEIVVVVVAVGPVGGGGVCDADEIWHTKDLLCQFAKSFQ